jgi:hypothetical protein
MTIRVRQWQKLAYRDPAFILRGLRTLATSVPLHELPYDLRSFRRRDVKKYGEGRQAAMFCYAMASLSGVPIDFALVEESDYDFVAAYKTGDVSNFVPVQLKELVPAHVNPRTNLQDELDKIAKYVDSKDLVIAIHLNTEKRIEFSELRLPVGMVAELWFFGATVPDQSTWVLIGNMLGKNPVVHRFRYPDA